MLGLVRGTEPKLTNPHSPLGKLGLDGIEDHPRDDAVWAQGLARVGSWRGRGHRAHKICVSSTCSMLVARSWASPIALRLMLSKF